MLFSETESLFIEILLSDFTLNQHKQNT